MIDPYILKNISQYTLPYKTNTRILNGIEFEITYNKRHHKFIGSPFQTIDIYVKILTPISLKYIHYFNKTLQFYPILFEYSYKTDDSMLFAKKDGIFKACGSMNIAPVSDYEKMSRCLDKKLFTRIKNILDESIRSACEHLVEMYNGDMKKAPSIYIDSINMLKCSYESFKEQLQNEYNDISNEDILSMEEIVTTGETYSI